jgi:hypothetical protein
MHTEDKRMKLLGMSPGDFIRAADFEALVGRLNGLAELNFSVRSDCGHPVQLGFRRRRLADGDVWETVR